jgi:RimJ/RimL family protein N-acetyltransferase
MTLHIAQMGDYDFYYQLRSEPSNIYWTAGEGVPDYEDMKSWFEGVVEHQGELQARKIYIVEDDEGHSVGYLYINPEGDSYEQSVAISDAYMGHGYGTHAIALGLEEGRRLGFKRMTGCIREDNLASLKAHSACGITITKDYLMRYFPGDGCDKKMWLMHYDL